MSKKKKAIEKAKKRAKTEQKRNQKKARYNASNWEEKKQVKEILSQQKERDRRNKFPNIPYDCPLEFNKEPDRQNCMKCGRKKCVYYRKYCK